jgi:nucleoside-triphosphatase
VDVLGFEEFISRMPFSDHRTRVVMIDEIGKMECFSKKFQRIILEVLAADKTFIATIALKGAGLVAEIKRRRDIRLFEVTRKNQDIIISKIKKSVNLIE